MIPKHIITAWFGRGAKKDLFRRCVDSWHRIHPDWKFFEANEDTIEAGNAGCRYYRAVMERGEFVKATEWGRLVGLQEWGGVYLDMDVELLKPLDALLGHDFFIGREDDTTINGAVIGSVANGAAISHLVARFPGDTDGMEKATAYGPTFLTSVLNANPSLTPTILAPDFFYPWRYDQTPGTGITPNTYTAHHWAGSWK